MILRGKKKDRIKKLYELRKKMRDMKKEEEELLATLKKEMDNGHYKCGDLFVDVATVERESFDKKKLEKKMGKSFIKRFTSITSFEAIYIKKAE